MNYKYRATDIADINLVAAKQTGNYQHRQQLRQASLPSYQSVAEQRIEDMLQSHSRYYIYCE